MEDLQEKMRTLLADPELMQKVGAMAKSLGLSQDAPPAQSSPKPAAPLPNLDPAMLSQLSGMLGQGSIDNHQQTLLRALSPYLSAERISKLEKAMRAAAMAKVASTLWGKNGIF